MRVDREELLERLDAASQAVPAGRYRHIKGHVYEVIGVCLREEDGEPCVIYSDEELTWTRTVRKFLERTPQGPRFERID